MPMSHHGRRGNNEERENDEDVGITREWEIMRKGEYLGKWWGYGNNEGMGNGERRNNEEREDEWDLVITRGWEMMRGEIMKEWEIIRKRKMARGDYEGRESNEDKEIR